MEYETRDYFKEHDEDDVNGFAIIETENSEPHYHVAEKWLASSASEADSKRSEDKWIQYWIASKELQSRIDEGKCSKKAQLSEDQFDAILDRLDISIEKKEPAVA